MNASFTTGMHARYAKASERICRPKYKRKSDKKPVTIKCTDLYIDTTRESEKVKLYIA